MTLFAIRSPATSCWAGRTRNSTLSAFSRRQNIRPLNQHSFFINTDPREWGVEDSNLRRQCQQIYSLSPLTARETPLIQSFMALLGPHDAIPPKPSGRENRLAYKINSQFDNPHSQRTQASNCGRQPEQLPRSHRPEKPENHHNRPRSEKSKASDGNRTCNLLITNQLLCQLSYAGENTGGDVAATTRNPEVYRPHDNEQDRGRLPHHVGGLSGPSPSARVTKRQVGVLPVHVLSNLSRAFLAVLITDT
jgi:hypothetical protein